MDIEQLKSNWQQQLTKQSSDEHLVAGKHMQAIEDKMIILDRNIKSRTLYGTITFVLILVSMSVFGYFQYLITSSIITSLGFLSWAVAITVSLIRLFLVKRRYNLGDNTLTIRKSLQNRLATVESEIQFYLSTVWKILAPMSIGFILLLVGIAESLPLGTKFLPFAAGQVTLFILCCYFSYRYNKYYVAKNLTPIKEEITANLQALSKKE
jgi:hypothetical protein